MTNARQPGILVCSFSMLMLGEKNLTLFRSLKEPFGGKTVQISDCGTVRPLETAPACRAFGYIVKGKNSPEADGNWKNYQSSMKK